MSNLYPRAKLIWSLSGSGIGTTLAAGGNSGGWSNANPNAESAVDLRDVTDVMLMVSVGGVTGTPAFVAQLDLFDDLGNLYAGLIATTALAAAGVKTAAGGINGPTTGTYLVFPSWGRVSWSGLSSTSVTGTEIALYGR